MPTIRTKLVALSCVTVLAGCGGTAAFTNLFPDNKPEHIDLVLDTVGEPASTTSPLNGTGKPLAAAVLDEGKALGVFDLSAGKMLWRKSVAIDSAPAVGPGVVIARSGDEVVAFDVSSGERLWSKGLVEDKLYGFAFDGNMVFITQGNTDGGFAATGQRGVIWALDVQSGARKWSMDVPKMLGAPAARGGLVFIPWDRQSISVLDAATGGELCRLLRRDGTVDFVIAQPEGVFYGGKTDILRLTSRSAGGTKDGAAYVDFDPTQMPGQPLLYTDGYESSKPSLGARARIKLMWSPDAASKDNEIKLGQDSIYFLFYRYIISLGATDGQARWVSMFEKPLAWTEAGKAGLYTVDETGAVTYIDGQAGGTVELGTMGEKPESCDFDTGDHAPKVEGDAGKLIWGLRDLVFDVDTQVLPLRKYALTLMVALPDDAVTMDLLEIMRSAYVPKAMKDQAALLLREREGGVDFLKDALKFHANFLEQMDSPPVGAIASSLAHAGEKGALPLLLSHLSDHETLQSDLPELTAAILELGDVSAVPELKMFLVKYHADSVLDTQLDVLTNVAEAIIKFGGDEGKAFVFDLANDGWTGSVLRLELIELAK
jgi:hypothetical protein